MKKEKTINKNSTAGTFYSVNDLLKYLDLDEKDAPYQVAYKTRFPCIVPKSFAQRMRKRQWRDPLLLQVLPRREELVRKKGFASDPVRDAKAEKVPGLLHKYRSRVLLLSSNRCAVRCRYCFRRKFPCGPVPAIADAWEPAFDYCRKHGGIDEIVLSGGDPLCLAPLVLERFLERIAGLAHIKTVRIHTRVPIADPGRITRRLLESISIINSIKNCVIVIHANHPAELAGDCSLALTRLRATGSLLFNQSVLLKGINDHAETLCALSCVLLDHGVVPYYLHQLDRVAGAWHFEVDVETGKKLVQAMRERLPGYAVPRYVREVAGENSKIPL